MKIGTILTATFALGTLVMAHGNAAQAEGSMLQKCRPGSSRAVVEKCCVTWVKEHGKPYWMQEAGLSCSTAVSCSGGKIGSLTANITNVVPRCSLQPPPPGNGNPQIPRRRGCQTFAC